MILMVALGLRWQLMLNVAIPWSPARLLILSIIWMVTYWFSGVNRGRLLGPFEVLVDWAHRNGEQVGQLIGLVEEASFKAVEGLLPVVDLFGRLDSWFAIEVVDFEVSVLGRDICDW